MTFIFNCFLGATCLGSISECKELSFPPIRNVKWKLFLFGMWSPNLQVSLLLHQSPRKPIRYRAEIGRELSLRFRWSDVCWALP